jgi:hypothetical protein
MAEKAAGYAVDPAKAKFSGKNVKAVAVVDTLGYTDSDGYPRYEPRGSEVEMPAEEFKRLHDDLLEKGEFPAAVKPSHPHLDHLVKPVSAAEHPDIARLKLMQAHGQETGLLLTPAGEPVENASTLAAPAAPGGLAIQFGELDKATLTKVADAAGIETKGMSKDDLVAALSARQGAAGVTPRVGTASGTYGSEGAAGGSEDGS